jgi:hypothetical protein
MPLSIGLRALQISALTFPLGRLGGRQRLAYLDGLVLSVQTDETSFHLVQYRSGRPHKGPFDVLLALGRGLNVEHLVVPSQFEGLFPGDHAFREHVAFVAHQDHHHIFVAVVLDVFDPPGHVAEGLLAGEVEDNEGCCGGAVVGAGHGFELFLAGCVPNLYFDDFAIDCDVFGCKLHSHGVLMVGIEPAVDKASDNAGFADCHVSNQDELKTVVESGPRVHHYQ